ncbi:MAG: hypothetical protein RI560_01535 [Natronomonas sp.]|nr:hypothetical protein [Natronomonas sp.]
MVGSRTLTALVGIVGSLALSVLLYAYTDSLLFFLFVPFIPFLFARRDERTNRSSIRECSRCEFTTRTPEFEYCPRDGSRLYERTDD